MSKKGGLTNASRLSKAFGTEQDKWNCPFYQKIGACRHGDRCARNHVRPSFSQTLSIPHMYIPPPPDENQNEQEAFEDFFEDVLHDVKKNGPLLDMIVVQNLGEHMNGNVYLKFENEDDAQKCVEDLSGRYYNGIKLYPALSPVTDFREARCSQHEDETCNRGGFCNFMHIRKLPRWLQKELDTVREEGRREIRERQKRGRSMRRGRSRSRSASYSRSRSRSLSPLRSDSTERRELFAQWNREREERERLQKLS